ncbi:MAG: hypothetical protein OEY10_05210, partial [Nitrosopumilus sp.]|nr:hypothetical protein [Nitrosopumilus sp.]
GAGNQTTSETVIFHIDQTPPLLVNKSIDNSGAYACAVNFEVTDSASGIESLVLGASDGTFISSRSSTIGAVIKGSKVDELGIFRTIALYAYDNAGNHTVYSFCMEHYYNKTPIGIPDVFSCKFSSSGCGLG